MANRFLGEATVEADGRRYTLRCDFNAMCAFEDATGKNALAAFEAFEAGKSDTRDMRAMMWAFMRHHHPEATLADAGDLLSANIGALMDVVQAASPTSGEAAALGNARRKARTKAAKAA